MPIQDHHSLQLAYRILTMVRVKMLVLDKTIGFKIDRIQITHLVLVLVLVLVLATPVVTPTIQGEHRKTLPQDLLRLEIIRLGPSHPLCPTTGPERVQQLMLSPIISVGLPVATVLSV